MSEQELSPADAELRERITELSVHIPCGGLRGPVPPMYRRPAGQPMGWQSCPDEDAPVRWEGHDVSRSHDLCIVCVRGTAGGTSRWSWLACENCRSVNDALEAAWGYRPLALGRHSIMNGVAIRGGVSPEVRQRQEARLEEFLEHHRSLSDWKKFEFTRLAAVFDPLADVPLRVWQEQWPPSRGASRDAITRLLTGEEAGSAET